MILSNAAGATGAWRTADVLEMPVCYLVQLVI